MKKLLLLLAAAGAGFAVFRKMQQDRAEQDLWNEAIFDDDPMASGEPAAQIDAAGEPVVDLR